MEGIFTELKQRGLIHQSTYDYEEIHIIGGVYCGFDPTADSLHVGSLLPLMALAHFWRQGYRVFAVVGGATGLIGDPSGKGEERTLQSSDVVDKNVQALRTQIERFLSRIEPERERGLHLLNNAEWMKPQKFLTFLRDVGKYFRVNSMISKESVKSRLDGREQGISYTEFSYMLIQAYDFYHLHEEWGCNLQIGGSDQWGNITAGIDLIHKKADDTAYGVTFPLLTDPDGKKFGKTESGTVWLDPNKTSPYEFYQYWLNQPDDEVPRLLRMLTFLPLDEIEVVEAEIKSGHNRGEAQELLATEITKLVHGDEGVQKARRASEILFGGKIENVSDAELNSIFVDVNSTEIERSRIEKGVSVLDLFTEARLRSSKSEVRRLVKQGGAYLNNEKVKECDSEVNLTNLTSESIIVLRAGKKKYHLVKVI